MKKLSIIIPTLQKNFALLENLIKTFSKDKVVGEIIIIDNSLKGIDINNDKLRVVIPDENLFVNPSWNLGIKLAKYEYFGLINDDIIVQDDFCSVIMEHYKDGMGLIGIDSKFVIDDRSKADQIGHLKFPQNKYKVRKLKRRENNFGIAIFGEKSCYTPIPEEIKIWCGDDYLFDYNKDRGRNNYSIQGLTVYHIHNLSSSISKYDQVKLNDFALYKPKNASDYKFIEKIFSVKSRKQDGYAKKIICILGYKFSIKIKKLEN